ncbi:MAG: hypothetical protein BWY65_01937 [Firmicutes bacterium ADurb.Bin373]|nr:hypothetical protein [Bacillota bacterium]OQA07273.1 MAG: hypothetical protein BWY65_01937 [Firmicutes bacterium ADurb.Bin373]
MTNYMSDNFPFFVLLLCLGVLLIQLLIPYGTTVAIFATVFIPMAQAAGINPWLIGFIILFIADGNLRLAALLENAGIGLKLYEEGFQ